MKNDKLPRLFTELRRLAAGHHCLRDVPLAKYKIASRERESALRERLLERLTQKVDLSTQ